MSHYFYTPSYILVYPRHYNHDISLVLSILQLLFFSFAKVSFCFFAGEADGITDNISEWSAVPCVLRERRDMVKSLQYTDKVSSFDTTGKYEVYLQMATPHPPPGKWLIWGENPCRPE